MCAIKKRQRDREKHGFPTGGESLLPVQFIAALSASGAELGKEQLLNKLVDKACFKCPQYILSVSLTFFKIRIHDEELDEGNFRHHGEGEGNYIGKRENPQKGNQRVGYQYSRPL